MQAAIDEKAERIRRLEEKKREERDAKRKAKGKGSKKRRSRSPLRKGVEIGAVVEPETVDSIESEVIIVSDDASSIKQSIGIEEEKSNDQLKEQNGDTLQHTAVVSGARQHIVDGITKYCKFSLIPEYLSLLSMFLHLTRGNLTLLSRYRYIYRPRMIDTLRKRDDPKEMPYSGTQYCLVYCTEYDSQESCFFFVVSILNFISYITNPDLQFSSSNIHVTCQGPGRNARRHFVATHFLELDPEVQLSGGAKQNKVDCFHLNMLYIFSVTCAYVFLLNVVRIRACYYVLRFIHINLIMHKLFVMRVLNVEV